MIGSLQFSFAVRWNSQRCIFNFSWFVGACRGCTSPDVTDSSCVPCLMMPQLVLAAEITCEFWNWVVSPFLLRFCHRLRPTHPSLSISLHSLTAWTLCCAYCSVTHLSFFLLLKGVFYPNQLICLWNCRSRLFVFLPMLILWCLFGV